MPISVIKVFFLYSKKAFFIFSVIFIIITGNSCSTLEGLWNTLLFIDTLNERDDSVEKIKEEKLILSADVPECNI
jgi:hypothetical protein